MCKRKSLCYLIYLTYLLATTPIMTLSASSIDEDKDDFIRERSLIVSNQQAIDNDMLNSQFNSIVSNIEELNMRIINANNDEQNNHTITLNIGFTLDRDITPINTTGSVITTIQSDDNAIFTIDGAAKYKGFTINSGTVILENLIITNMLSAAQEGCLGSGGIVDVRNTSNNPSTLKLINTKLLNSRAMGGDAPCTESGGTGGKGESGAYAILATDGSGGVTLNNDSAGAFGQPGVGGSGGKASNDFECNGKDGAQGGQSGYGAGSSTGGGGGGGGCSYATEYSYGGTGGSGGGRGLAGFGGGIGYLQDPGQPGVHGTGDSDDPGQSGHGGNGGIGARMGAGAGFGGAIFITDSTNLTFSGPGEISGNTAIGGQMSTAETNGASAGNGMFFQGSGTVTFDLANATYVINDDIVDEKGAVNAQLVSNVLEQTDLGVWGLAQSTLR